MSYTNPRILYFTLLYRTVLSAQMTEPCTKCAQIVFFTNTFYCRKPWNCTVPLTGDCDMLLTFCAETDIGISFRPSALISATLIYVRPPACHQHQITTSTFSNKQWHGYWCMWLWSIHFCFHWRKNYKNRLRNARVIVENKVVLFFPDTLYKK